MFSVSLFSIIIGLYYFAEFYSFDPSGSIWSAVIAAAVVSITELFTPKGYDNITVPLLGATVFMFSGGF
jgi:dolichol kinase